MNDEQFRRVWKHTPAFSACPPAAGGQSLILPEILACLHDGESVWLPFHDNFTAAVLHDLGHKTYGMEGLPDNATALYFGTPTIMNDQPLFPAYVKTNEGNSVGTVGKWDKETERNVVRALIMDAEHFDYRIVISGLGTGDISVDERLADIGGGKVVAYKDFGLFEDWLIVRELRDD